MGQERLAARPEETHPDEAAPASQEAENSDETAPGERRENARRSSGDPPDHGTLPGATRRGENPRPSKAAEGSAVSAARDNHTPEGVWCRVCRAFRCMTVQSRHAKEGIIRRRKCATCGHVFRTIETHYSEKNGHVCDDYPAVEVRSTWAGRKRPKK